MAEVKVTKGSAKAGLELTRLPGFELPLFRGGMFGVNPFTLMRQFTDAIDRVFSNLVAGVGEEAVWQPTMEIKEKEGKLLITAELPGVKKDDVKVYVTDDILTVEGERREEKEEKHKGYYHSERRYGRFSRSIPLPEGAEVDKALAQFANGVLEIAIPVPETRRRKKEIQVEETSKVKSAA